jgi:hypothetical protein
MRIEVDIKTVKSEFSYARTLLAEGRATREDVLVFMRDGKPAISSTVGWWADHTVIENSDTGPIFAKYRPPARLRNKPPDHV